MSLDRDRLVQESEHLPSHIRGKLAFVFPPRDASRRQIDAIASVTNVVVVEALIFQAVTLPFTACRNMKPPRKSVILQLWLS